MSKQDYSNEKWLSIPGWEGYYEVSDHGRVRSLSRIVLRNGHKNRMKGKLLSPVPHPKWGYLRTCLCRNGFRSLREVHTLVLLAFVGPCPKGMECCHNDSDPSNNLLENLRYDTHINNEADKDRCLSLPQVREIRRRYAAGGITQRQLGVEYGKSQGAVNQLLNRVTWKNV